MANTPILALLLLPPPPQPPSAEALEAAYRPPLTAALQRLKQHSVLSSTTSSLDIALPYHGYTLGQSQRTFSGCEESHLHAIQDLLGDTYAFISSICDQQSIGSHQADIRVLLLGYDQAFNYETLVRPTRSIPSCIVELSILALCDRNWSHVYVTEGEPGERLYKQFRALVNGSLSSRVGGTWETERVPGGMIFNMTRSSQAATAEPSETVPHSVVDKSARKRVLVVGEMDKYYPDPTAPPLSPTFAMRLSQKLRLTLALTSAEYHSRNPLSTDAEKNDNLVEAASLHPNDEAIEVAHFLQAIANWRIAGDRFAKTQTPNSLLHFDTDADGLMVVRPWPLVYIPDSSRLERFFRNRNDAGKENEVDTEHTIFVSERQLGSMPVPLLGLLGENDRTVSWDDFRLRDQPVHKN
ncbi:hypothetical protein FQN53_003673 [Emmonsiellopsis sp. PD_33]|nr:hypothetical protein FQN53_003673 [Emmonsiellopsis sp. PD_33]